MCTHRGMVSTKLRSAVNVVVIANLPMNSVRRVIVIICKRKNGRFVETEKIRFRQNSGFKPRPGRFCGIDQNWPDFASLIVVVERVNFGLPTIQELHRFLTLRRLRGLITPIRIPKSGPHGGGHSAADFCSPLRLCTPPGAARQARPATCKRATIFVTCGSP